MYVYFTNILVVVKFWVLCKTLMLELAWGAMSVMVRFTRIVLQVKLSHSLYFILNKLHVLMKYFVMWLLAP